MGGGGWWEDGCAMEDVWRGRSAPVRAVGAGPLARFIATIARVEEVVYQVVLYLLKCLVRARVRGVPQVCACLSRTGGNCFSPICLAREAIVIAFETEVNLIHGQKPNALIAHRIKGARKRDPGWRRLRAESFRP